MIVDAATYTCAAGHEINEDSHLCSESKGIFIVADGLGGHSDGEKASMAAINYFDRNCLGGYTDERITELLEGANTEVINSGDGGKTTVAAAFIEKDNFIYANAGDSRVYYFREGKIIAQTRDHSVCQASVDMGMLRPEDVRRSEDRSRLLKVLGSEDKLNIKKHYQPIQIQDDDAFLVCSDGFWDYVYESEMEADLLKAENAAAWLKFMLKRHILRAENEGDNYTAVCGIIHMNKNSKHIPAASASGSEVSGNKKSPLAPIAAICAVIAVAVVSAALFAFRSPGDNMIPAGTDLTVSTEVSSEKESQTTDADADENIDTDIVTEPDTVTESFPDTEAYVVTEAATVTETDIVTNNDTSDETGSGTEENTATGSGTETEPDAEGTPAPEQNAGTEAGAEETPAPEQNTGTEAGAEETPAPEPDGGAEAGNNTEATSDEESGDTTAVTEEPNNFTGQYI
ncbi:MAG: protein phosphatase 2C domain-containing protein [Oscillospiraceae bacterium]|nr:protein phosphatase 2C domain-containing protein [Oscillospiraceae bacterium]